MTISILPNPEINISDVQIDNPTEYQHIELCKHFKETLEKKEYKIERLSKTSAVIYGLLTLLSREQDPVIFQQLYSYVEQEMEWLLGLD